MKGNSIRSALGASLFAGFLVVGCSHALGPDSETVGGACSVDTQCQSRCLVTKHFPGMCTVSCRADTDCPSGGVCIDVDNSSVCAIACVAPQDCSGFPGWTCAAEGRPGTGQALVCRSP